MNPDQAQQTAQALTSLSVWVPVIVVTIGGIFGVIKVWATYLINSRVKDAELAKQLDNAVENSLGVIQQVAQGAIEASVTPKVQSSPIPARLKPGVQYVLDHAAEGVDRYQTTWRSDAPIAIAAKIASREGLAAIQTNLAISGAATPVVAPPLSATPPAADLPAGIIIGATS